MILKVKMKMRKKSAIFVGALHELQTPLFCIWRLLCQFCSQKNLKTLASNRKFRHHYDVLRHKIKLFVWYPFDESNKKFFQGWRMSLILAWTRETSLPIPHPPIPIPQTMVGWSQKGFNCKKKISFCMGKVKTLGAELIGGKSEGTETLTVI